VTNVNGSDDGWSTGGFPVPARPPIPGYPDPGSAALPDATRQGWYPDGQPAPLAGWPEYPSPQYSALSQSPQPPYPQQPYPPQPYLQPPYPQQPYPPPVGPAGYPAYPPPAGYPGYPAYPALAGRPGTATGAAVLAFVAGGADLIGALITFLALAAVSGSASSAWSSGASVAGVGAVAAGGVLIAGGVRMLRGLPALLYVGAGLTVAVALYWYAMGGRLDDAAGQAAFRVYPTIYVALVAVMVGLAASRSARQWRPDGPRHG
jgi:hypothetical protein